MISIASFLMEFCHCCGDGCDCGCVLDCELLQHRAVAEVASQPDGHKAEMIGACRLTTPHDRHDWHYSYTGYAECPGVPNQSDRS